MLRVLSLNVWGTNPPLEERMSGLAAYLRETRPHAVALQEVEDRDGRPLAHHLAEAAAYPTVHHVRSGDGHDPGEGLAILTVLDADPAPTLRLPGDATDHPRALQQVDAIAPDGQLVRLANTHLAWRLDATALRTAQAQAIADALADWSGPAVVLGDLNDVAGSAPWRALVDAGFVDCYAALNDAERWTFDADNPYLWQPELANRRVDHILARGCAVVASGVVLTGTDGPLVSDHYGVRADLRPGTGG